MQKLYNLVKVSVLLLLLLIQNTLQAQNDCSDCPSNVKMISDKQVLLDKIVIKEGNSATLNTNVYVSYSSGDAQKFWANLAIATAGVAVSTQLGSTPIGAGDSKTASNISPLIPLGVSVAMLPSIWKNRPRGVPQVGLWLQHRDTRGKLTDTWEQPISSEAKNSGELLTVNIDKFLSAGTVEIYLQNGSKNPVYYWGYETVKNITKLIEKKTEVVANKPNKSARMAGCPDGYLPNGQGQCCNPFTGECVNEGGGGTPTTSTKTEIRTVTTTEKSGGGGGGCPEGYLPNGQGMCCNPFTGDCVFENQGSSVAVECITTWRCVDTYIQDCIGGDCGEWILVSSVCTVVSVSCNDFGGDGGGGGGGGGNCANGRDAAGNPCGPPICGTNGYNQFGIKCGRNCNETTGWDQFGDPCGPSICGIVNPDFTSDKQARVASYIDQYGNECKTVEEKCIDDIYKNFFHPKQKEINDKYTAEYSNLLLGVLGSVLGAWLQFTFTDFSVGFDQNGLFTGDIRKYLKETWKTFLVPFALFYAANEFDQKIKSIEFREKAENEDLDIETIRRINACKNL